MDILRLLAVFAVIVITTRLKKPLWMALAGASSHRAGLWPPLGDLFWQRLGRRHQRDHTHAAGCGLLSDLFATAHGGAQNAAPR